MTNPPRGRPFLVYGAFLVIVCTLFVVCFFCGAVIQGWA